MLQILKNTSRSRLLVFLACVVSLFVFFSRFLLRSPYLYTWDSVNYALSLEHFDIGLHQPHPPGYLLYSFSLRVLNWLIGDANLTMILFNIAATIGACIFMMLLVLELARPRGNETAPEQASGREMWMAAGAAMIYATNPISWFYGSIAEIYAVDGFFSMCICYFVIASFRRPKFLIHASIMLAIAGGFRPTTEVFLFPLYLFGFVRKDRKTILISVVLLILLNAAWIYALLSLSGGWDSYMQKIVFQSTRSAKKTSILSGETPQRGADIYSIPLLVLQAMTAPLFFALLFHLRRIRISRLQLLLLVVIIPALLFFFFVHFAKDGYLLLVTPPVIALSAVLLSQIYQSRVALISIIVAACLMNVLIFLYAPSNAQKGDKQFVRWATDEFTTPNRIMIQEHTGKYNEFFRQISLLPREHRKLFVARYNPYPNWRTVMYYFPEDEILNIAPEKQSHFCYRHKVRFVRAPLRIRDRLIVALGRKEPEIPMNDLSIGGERYHYIESNELPKRFQLYGFRFVQR
jgi:transmembrane protein TMEM260 (protein O-mannosyltransferase)